MNFACQGTRSLPWSTIRIHIQYTIKRKMQSIIVLFKKEMSGGGGAHASRSRRKTSLRDPLVLPNQGQIESVFPWRVSAFTAARGAGRRSLCAWQDGASCVTDPYCALRGFWRQMLMNRASRSASRSWQARDAVEFPVADFQNIVRFRLICDLQLFIVSISGKSQNV